MIHDIKGLVQDFRKVKFPMPQFENTIYSRVYFWVMKNFVLDKGYEVVFKNLKSH